ncbi:phage distal tail protein [Streptomyces beijiangensis]|uniref:Phage tail family protein n=1 Tax=Streptomyces beijiangensis TaxID=163361 RepID=A0A939JG39_9ACTN|nr:phage tail domain-containing protein [Streptomyces beijiangensis]MBO0514786.1 phage tail family protein [Streptomyces beijiangensis]
MAALTTDYQADLAGLLLGPGTPYVIGDVVGLGAPELRTQDVDSATEDGTFPGVDYYGARTVRIEAAIRTPGDPAAAFDALARLHEVASTPSVRKTAGALAVLRLRQPGRDVRRLYGRIRRANEVSTSQAIYGWIPVEIEFTATDPRFNDDILQSISLPLDISQTTQGFKAPLVSPITTGVANPSVRPGWVTNAGDLPAWPTVRITGPVTNPKVWIVETGRALELGITLGVGEWVDIETRPGTRWVLRNGSGNASTALTSASRLDLFTIPPGTSEIRWTATDYTNSARLALSWRDAYTALSKENEPWR